MDNFNQNKVLHEKLLKKWAPILESKDAAGFQNADKKVHTAILLENQAKAIQQDKQMLAEATPTNVTAGVAKWDPVLIAMVRRTAPSLIANDVVGVQPMSGPTGLAFAMKARYTNQAGAEALGLNEPNSAFTGAGTQAVNDIFAVDAAVPPNETIDHGTGMTTAAGEGNITPKMAFTVDKISVEAKTRALATEWSDELSQDMQAIHSMDPESILADILSTELVSEMNRELIRTIYKVAKPGAANTTTAGVIDVQADSDGRWFVEKFKGLMLHLSLDANQIYTDTRRGRGNFLIVSQNVATALAESGKLDYDSPLAKAASINNAIENSTFAGVLNGQFKVYIDPYMDGDFAIVGYKGSTELDAGLFYCPYVPFYVRKTIDENSFQPKMAFKTRYGVVANPFVENAGVPDAMNLTRNINPYYRKIKITNLF